jgi:large subunit ribosomal protein L4
MQILPNVYFNRYSTLLAPANEVLIPTELLSSKSVWTPDRELGLFLVFLIHLLLS